MNEIRTGGTPINPSCSEDLKGKNNTSTFTFTEAHAKCILAIATGNSSAGDGAINCATTVGKYELLYGNLKTFNGYLCGGLLAVYLENVQIGDTVTVQGGGFQTNSCVIDL